MTADQSLICPKCQGVIAAADPAAYTPARARLIVSQGFCQGKCSDVEHEPRPEESAVTAGSHRRAVTAGAS
ncbi:hypothetical protein GCM10010149_14910 [Nonomuraea roseoviolacea subsp. roseoviolacea]|uniref:C4-type Zn-finger protein n=1 Tax=Nonomuraea roseoviolacea subsp. carminata TaxID=160689 RepID=A0ABT1KBV2_9ACTN|nr:hypothetical protein [Nonomuraea roseoviolacea]MCP2351431.1 C4-type Zn-finger protein [Nonomuraea roseoviolacea subsp. carminata]